MFTRLDFGVQFGLVLTVVLTDEAFVLCCVVLWVISACEFVLEKWQCSAQTKQ